MISLVAVCVRGACLALRMDIAGAAFALPTLGCHTQLQLKIVKAHACPRMARDVAVRNSVANTDYHSISVNENDS
jgi:hypothetical protein